METCLYLCVQLSQAETSTAWNFLHSLAWIYIVVDSVSLAIIVPPLILADVKLDLGTLTYLDGPSDWSVGTDFYNLVALLLFLQNKNSKSVRILSQTCLTVKEENKQSE